jgi:putative DNA primase/helicase
LAGFPIFSLDNVNGELGGDLLCQAIERPLIRLRPLGASNIVEIESRATLFATGNGMRVRGDMTRRTLICDLDANVERPELRKFAGDPVATVMANRGRYVSACLTVVRAYIAAGSPNPLPPIASFADWSRLVRSALVWLKCSDPAASMETAREDDPELMELAEAIAIWRACIRLDEAHTCQGLADIADLKTPTRIGEPTDYAHPEWRGFLMRLASERGVIKPRRLSAWIRKFEGRIVSGHRIVRTTKAEGGIWRYAVQKAAVGSMG